MEHRRDPRRDPFEIPATINPWKRKIVHIRRNDRAVHRVFLGKPIHTSKAVFKPLVDFYSKRAVLKVSSSVVTLISYSGGKQVFWGSGVIFGSFWKNNSLYYSVLTSATLLRPPPYYRFKNHALDSPPPREDHEFVLVRCCKDREDSTLPIDDKIDVYLKGGNLCEGTVLTYDFHYNIAILTFKSDGRLPCAVLRPLDDSLAVNDAPTNPQASACCFRSLPLKLVPGDVVTAVGRKSHLKLWQLLVNIGTSSSNQSSLLLDETSDCNCMELFTADCKITKCGIGGPLISRAGEVIGINFYSEDCTPFLPINVFLKWWSHHRVTRTHCRPWLGIKVANLQTADLGILDQVQNLGISQGLIIEEVLSGSPAEICGLRPGDIVFKCSDITIVSPLQFFETIWDMTGKVVDIVVVREGSYKSIKIQVKDITSPDE